MGRFTEIETIVRQKEAISPRVEITWDIVSNSAKIYFYVSQAIYEDGRLVSVEPDSSIDMGRLHVNFDSIMSRIFNVPLPNGSEQPVPAMLIMGAIKQAFDEIYTEYRESQPTPTPTPTQTVLITPTIPPTQTIEPTPTPQE